MLLLIGFGLVFVGGAALGHRYGAGFWIPVIRLGG